MGNPLARLSTLAGVNSVTNTFDTTFYGSGATIDLYYDGDGNRIAAQ